MKLKLSIVCLMAVAVAALCVCGDPTSEVEVESGAIPGTKVRANFSPAKLFDFKTFKQMFHKKYSGLVEELVRAKYYLARAFRALITSIKYKCFKARYYLKVNEMSDSTPSEIKQEENKVLEGEESSASRLEAAEELAESRKMDPGYKDTGIVMDGAGDGDEETEVQMVSRANRNVPEYRSLELKWSGPTSKQEKINIWELKDAASNIFTETYEAFFGKEQQEKKPIDPSLPDEVFVDLRETGCFTTPRQQGHCGACYAFAITAIFEWLHCTKTGRLVPFSEQYLIDCGKEHVKGVRGCNGGSALGGAHFYKNFGLELSAGYPYKMRAGECPFDDVIRDLKQTGAVRIEFDDAVEIPIEAWPKYLKTGPLWMSVSTGQEFREYGGGVYGHKCPQKKASHAVVLVGHGREDGEEYWLLRNSYSVGWGEAGYAKLSKNANCIFPQTGWLYASKDGQNLNAKVSENRYYNPNPVKNQYGLDMLQNHWW